MDRLRGARREGRGRANFALLENLESRVLLTGELGTPATPLGVHLELNRDWSRSFMFVDAMKSAREFGSAAAPWDGNAAVGADGWPMEDFGAVVITLYQEPGVGDHLPDISGTYHLTAKGHGHVDGVASDLSVENEVYDPETDTLTADVVVHPGATQLYLNFTGTDDGLKDVRLIRPGYAADTTQVFTDNFVASLAPFQTIRLMNYLSTNNNPVADWNDRTKPDDPIQTSDKGAAWEYAIDLANQLDKDLWINVPAHATDDYVTQLATMLKNDLEPERKIYLEYSNEVWNGSYEQGWWNYGQAVADVETNPDYFNFDHVDNEYIWAVRRVADRLVHVGDLFSQVYGDGEMMTTVRPVLGSQIAWPYILRQQLNFMEHFYGPVSDHIWAVGGAPYINIGELSDKPDLTVDEVIQRLNESTVNLQDAMSIYDTLAAYYGVKTVLYEGGVDLAGDTNGNLAGAKIPANYDPRIQQVVSDYLHRAYALGADQLMWMNIASGYDVSGTWGLTEDLSELGGPKYAGIQDFVNAPRPAVSIGNLLPGCDVGGNLTIDAGKYTSDEWGTKGTGTVLTDETVGRSLDYLLQVPRSGPYTLMLRAGSSEPGGKLQVLVDAQVVATLDVPDSGGAMVDLPVLQLGPGNLARSLKAGLHTVRLNVVEGTFSLESLRFEVTANFGPAGIVAKGAGTGGVDVTWEHVDGATGYYVERSADGVTGWTPVGQTVLAGDSNTDGVVDFADFVVMSNHFGDWGGWSEGDFNGDQEVNFQDFVVLSNHFGQVFDGTSAAGLSLHDGGTTPGQTYYYFVRPAFAGGTGGSESAVAAAVAGGAVVDPVAPVDSSANMVAAPTAVVASSAVTSTTTTDSGKVQAKQATKTPDHGGKKKVALARTPVQAERQVAAVQAAQRWWGWWRSVQVWMASAR